MHFTNSWNIYLILTKIFKVGLSFLTIFMKIKSLKLRGVGGVYVYFSFHLFGSIWLKVCFQDIGYSNNVWKHCYLCGFELVWITNGRQWNCPLFCVSHYTLMCGITHCSYEFLPQHPSLRTVGLICMVLNIIQSQTKILKCEIKKLNFIVEATLLLTYLSRVYWFRLPVVDSLLVTAGFVFLSTYAPRQPFHF